MGKVKSIVVCSRHSILVGGFRTLVAEPASLAMLVCPDLEDLPAFLTAHQPDLALIDAGSGLGLSALAGLKACAPDTGIILWVDSVASGFVREAIGSGARGVLRKELAVSLYNQCLDRVAAGRLWVDNEMMERLLSTREVRLSPRERQLMSLLTQGLRNKEIAWRMNITEGTTKVYLSRLFEKTGANDRFELAMFVLQNLETGQAAPRL